MAILGFRVNYVNPSCSAAKLFKSHAVGKEKSQIFIGEECGKYRGPFVEYYEKRSDSAVFFVVVNPSGIQHSDDNNPAARTAFTFPPSLSSPRSMFRVLSSVVFLWLLLSVV